MNGNPELGGGSLVVRLMAAERLRHARGQRSEIGEGAPMSFENLRTAYRTRLGNLTAKSVLVLIVDEASPQGLAFVSVNNVARLTEICKRATLRILQVFGYL